ncbi:DUF2857 domain-containing protein [Pantoea ananatis]|uniref:DUF2857 domain-containing protein n=1 Tax=Pantoea ananas TaxID=553 RepID=UPI00158A0E19|nr:DUF2857 domain-containing protein [Pantoea ananatis]MBA4823467.1 DUF2857 domain-containing protein [Pantoea ananatis]QKV88028.1 DUF2857 domain-containing protein [Pantoea ananatis]
MNQQNLPGATASILSSLLMDLKSGNIRRCESLGLSVEEIRALSGLSLDELHYINQSKVSVLDVKFNHENFWLILNQARNEQARMLMIDRALELGGSMELMNEYFGMSPSDVSSRRRLMGIESRQGRTQSLAEEQDALLWNEWKNTGLESPESHKALEVMMLAAELHGLSLTAVWTKVCQWCREASKRVPSVPALRKEV